MSTAHAHTCSPNDETKKGILRHVYEKTTEKSIITSFNLPQELSLFKITRLLLIFLLFSC